MTPAKNNWKNYAIQTFTAIFLLGAGALFSTVVWPAIERNTKNIQLLKDMRGTDYLELTSRLQGITADMRAIARERKVMDSLILDKLDQIDEKIGF